MSTSEKRIAGVGVAYGIESKGGTIHIIYPGSGLLCGATGINRREASKYDLGRRGVDIGEVCGQCLQASNIPNKDFIEHINETGRFPQYTAPPTNQPHEARVPLRDVVDDAPADESTEDGAHQTLSQEWFPEAKHIADRLAEKRRRIAEERGWK